MFWAVTPVFKACKRCCLQGLALHNPPQPLLLLLKQRLTGRLGDTEHFRAQLQHCSFSRGVQERKRVVLHTFQHQNCTVYKTMSTLANFLLEAHNINQTINAWKTLEISCLRRTSRDLKGFKVQHTTTTCLVKITPQG